MFYYKPLNFIKMDFKLILHVLIGALLALIVWELAIKKVVVKSFDSENL